MKSLFALIGAASLAMLTVGAYTLLRDQDSKNADWERLKNIPTAMSSMFHKANDYLTQVFSSTDLENVKAA